MHTNNNNHSDRGGISRTHPLLSMLDVRHLDVPRQGAFIVKQRDLCTLEKLEWKTSQLRLQIRIHQHLQPGHNLPVTLVQVVLQYPVLGPCQTSAANV